MRTFPALALTALCTLVATRANAATLDEWVLPASITPLDIDASQGAPIALVEAADVIDQFDPGLSQLTRWMIPPGVLQFTAAGQIQTHVNAARRFVFVTDAVHRRIGMLDVAGAQYNFWDVVIPAAQAPHALAVDHWTGDVWFTTYDGVGTPTVAKLDSSGLLTWWALPAVLASPADQIDGIVVGHAGGTLVYVALAQKQLLLEIDPLLSTARAWPLRYTRPTRIAVNTAGEIFAPDAGSNLVLQFNPIGAQQTLWLHPAPGVSFGPYVSTDVLGAPFWPATIGAMWFIVTPILAGAITNSPAMSFAPAFSSINSPRLFVPAVPRFQALSMISGPPLVWPTPPFMNYQVPSISSLSCDPTVPTSDTWYIDPVNDRVSRLRLP